MLTGLGRLSAVVWGFVGLWLFWMLASVCIDARQSLGENIKGAIIAGVGVALAYLMHWLTCWVLGGAARTPSKIRAVE